MQFLGLLILSGYNCLPCNRDYWSNAEDLGVEVDRSALTCNRYCKLAQNIHLADNTCLTLGEKVAKVSPLYTDINKNLLQFGIWQSNLSVDESMIPYYGRNSIKQFIRGKKPIRFGYKAWALCGSDGYPYHIKIYTGMDTSTDRQPLGLSVVNTMADIVIRHSQAKYHQLFFDNFFTSISLIQSLSEKGIRCVGTIRDNRTGGASKTLLSKTGMKKRNAGSLTTAVTVRSSC